MEVNKEWINGTESNLAAEFLVPDSLDPTSHVHDKDLPALQEEQEPGSPILFECNENPASSMASKKLTGLNLFAGGVDTETDTAEALVLDTASDFSGGSAIDESEKDITVVQRLSSGKTSDQAPSSPAQTLACLQLSGNPTLVPETCDSLDAVPPSLDAFDHHPTIVPDSPTEDRDNPLQGGEPEDNDEDDGVVSFKPAVPTMNESAMGETATQHSLGVIESQNFHLHLSPSQALSVPEDDYTDNAAVDFGLIPDAVTSVHEQEKRPAVPRKSWSPAAHLDPDLESRPSFRLHKPVVSPNHVEPSQDETEGSMSVFKRIKSKIASPMKLKKVEDDSEETVVPVRPRHMVLNFTESSPREKSEPVTCDKTVTHHSSKDTVFSREVNDTNIQQKDDLSYNSKTLTVDKGEQRTPQAKNGKAKESEKAEEAPAFTMVFTEDVDSNCENQDETLPYSYTETKEDMSAKSSKTHDDPQTALNKFSDSSSDHFILSQKRVAPSSLKKKDSGKKLKGTNPNEDDDEVPMIVEDSMDGHILPASTGLQQQQKNKDTTQDRANGAICSQKGDNSSVSHFKSAAAVVDMHHPDMTLKDKTEPSKGDHTGMEAVDEAGSSFSKFQTFVEGSTLAQSSSLDPYAFHGSQSQTFDTSARMPLSDKPYMSARGKTAAVIKTMRKVLRKKSSHQQAENKSSSSDVSVPEASMTRQGRRRKGGPHTKPASPDAREAAQPDGFTALQDKDHFSRPHDPAPTKSCVKQIAGNVSTDQGSQDPSRDNSTDGMDRHKSAKKSVTVSFSTNAVTSGTAHDVADSPDQELERTTTQELITSEVIVSKRTIREVFNSKGQSLRKTETTEILRRVRFEPQVTQQDVIEKMVSSGLVVSPSRSTSTVTTGDLADISSSSLSRTFSSGSKTSLEVLPSSQSLPTPAQRQKSTQKTDITSNITDPEGALPSKAATATLPSSFPVDVPVAASDKPGSKRSSTGSNTGQDLFSTPNQSIINPADSQLGKILSSSATSTPDQPPAQNTNILSQGLVAPNLSVLHSPSHPGSYLPNKSSEEQPGASHFNKAGGPDEGEFGGNIQQNTDISEISIVRERGLHMESNMSLGKSDVASPQRVVPSNLTLKPGSVRGRNLSGHSSKEDVGEVTDVQSTGFSIHGATASGDSGRGPTSTVTSIKTNLSVSAPISLQGTITKDQFTPYILNDYKSKPTIGAKVMGKWKDGFFYPGCLSKIESGKKAMVRFDDGSQRWARPSEIILASELPVGQSVLVLAEEDDGFYLPGMVMGHSAPTPGEGCAELLYQVERDDGVTQRCTRSCLMLSEDQAACLLSDEELHFCAEVCMTSAKPADISLDNLVEGKRGLKSAPQPEPSCSKTASVPSSPPSASTMDTTGASTSRSGRKRKVGPVATSTPTPKQARRGGKGTPVKGKVMSSLGSVMSSPVESRKSPRKLKTGPLSLHLARNSSLFEGMVFMLTHAEKSAKWRAYEKQLLQYSSLDTSVDESTDAEIDVTPYDKEQLQFMIQQCGGRIVSSFDTETISSASQCFLVAAEHQRTVKYMQALAASVHIISHQWVLLSVRENKLQELVAYTLPAGISYERKKLVEGSKGCPELSHQVIMVVSSSEDFVKAWTSILSLTRCQLATKFPARASKNDPGVDVVVSDGTCPASLVRRCVQLSVPLVSSEWVAQCLINGKMVGFQAHHKYRHDFMEDEPDPARP
ncbi:hypothetical protein EGW08_015644 [Elysia chlorotica]|uniref:BRCT domain-containing protein n=1 Tax=Elysia chlorotica TaxID=188477 RepID=A0A3S1HCK1_ELYCH|nr:hypothetical protein EGW08_015644 [Elysia chlorotica]